MATCTRKAGPITEYESYHTGTDIVKEKSDADAPCFDGCYCIKKPVNIIKGYDESASRSKGYKTDYVYTRTEVIGIHTEFAVERSHDVGHTALATNFVSGKVPV